MSSERASDAELVTLELVVHLKNTLGFPPESADILQDLTIEFQDRTTFLLPIQSGIRIR
jgi:hypothetical protein